MKNHRIIGGGDLQLNLLETGNPKGRPILFLHGFSQSGRSWNRQLNSELGEDYRLVAMDLRGHGLSDKPQEGYSESRLWADDVDAAIQTLGLADPILCGWSYGPLVILDYVRHYGEDRIGGIVFVGGITKLGSDEASSVITPEFLNLVPGFFSKDADESARSLGALLRLCLPQISEEDFSEMLGDSVSVPSHVREGLLSRSLDNDDLLPKIRKPVLIIQGVLDAVIKPAAADQHKASIAHARLEMGRLLQRHQTNQPGRD